MPKTKLPQMQTLFWPDGTYQALCNRYQWTGPNQTREADVRADCLDHDCATVRQAEKEQSHAKD